MTQETVMIERPPSPSTVLWQPRAADAVAHLRALLLKNGELPDGAACDRIEASASEILARCLPPSGGAARRRTGLVVGYVQSGKTLSMTTVASLARDNGFGLVVVLAGTTENLLDQSWKRFKSYLQVHSGPRRLWYMLTSANHELENNTDGLIGALESWRAQPPERRAAAFLVVMKNHAHLDQLARVLRTAEAGDVPAIVIDDEADQAGLNTNPSGVPSTTYSNIRHVRDALGPHTYLQYTATPQAPLLISIAEHLSPDFSVVLDAGAGYTGGRCFFVERQASAIVTIPASEIYSTGSAPRDPPETLLTALRIFFLGVALGYQRPTEAQKNRSMLIHPSPQQADHDVYYSWAVQICERWKTTLRQPANDPDVVETRAEFTTAIASLRESGAEIPDFDVLRDDLVEALDRVLIHRVNSTTGTEVDWSNAYAHILVGGQKLNRGYTVEGLTVTYMPRSAGTWTADTIQQLARFFGYKRRYIALCRVYLNVDLRTVFTSYIEHEEDMRTQLKEHPGPLKEWSRTLYLDSQVRPTRQQVLSNPYLRVDPTQWITQSAPFDPAILDANRELVARFRAQWSGQSVPHPRAPDRHESITVPLRVLLEHLLYPYTFVGAHDEAGFYAARHVMTSLLRASPDMMASVVLMGTAARTAREGEIVKLHQGYDRKTKGKAYPGAAAIHDDVLPTVQIHDLTVSFEGSAAPELPNVPTLAVRLPKGAHTGTMIHQPSPGRDA